MIDTRPLGVYLRDHEAAALAGVQLFRRISHSHRSRPWGAAVSEIATEVRQDWRSLRQLMTGLRVLPSPTLRVGAAVSERVSRLKPNGSLVFRTPLTDLIEIEAAIDAVHAKSRGWKALTAAGVISDEVDLADLTRRADHQQERLDDVHRQAARAAGLQTAS